MATTHEDRLRKLCACGHGELFENALTDAESAACLAGAEALRLVLLSRGQARAIHILTNVAHARNVQGFDQMRGDVCPACDARRKAQE